MQMFVDDLYLYFPIGVPPAMCMSKPIWTTDVRGLHQTIQSIIIPRACARGKAIGLSVCRCCRRRCRHENCQISRSRRLCEL